MYVIVTGGGRIGSQLARTLLELGHQVMVIEHRAEILERLHREVPTESIYEGDPTDPAILNLAGIRAANVVALLMDEDTHNLTVALLAHHLYHVPRVIARVNDPRTAWLFTEEMGVDVALNQAELFASLIEEEMSLGDMMTLLKLRRGEYSLVEEKIPAGAKAIGIAIKDLNLPDNCVIAAIIRHGEIVVPRGITQFEIGDEVLAITDRKGAAELAALLTPQPKTI